MYIYIYIYISYKPVSYKVSTITVSDKSEGKIMSGPSRTDYAYSRYVKRRTLHVVKVENKAILLVK